jgi:hypothetical protein
MFRLSAPDNDLLFFEGRSSVARCPVCGTLTRKWEEDLSSFPIPVTLEDDVSCSYDGVLVATARFRNAVIEDEMSGMAFRPLQAGFFAARPTTVVEFDSAARETRFEKLCPSCDNYESVTGATPVFLVPGSAVPENGFARTDLEFGTGDAKAPMVLCGNEAARRLKGRRLRGLTLVTGK